MEKRRGVLLMEMILFCCCRGKTLHVNVSSWSIKIRGERERTVFSSYQAVCFYSVSKNVFVRFCLLMNAMLFLRPSQELSLKRLNVVPNDGSVFGLAVVPKA